MAAIDTGSRLVFGGFGVFLAAITYKTAEPVYKAYSRINLQVEKSPNNRWLSVAKVCVLIGSTALLGFQLFVTGFIGSAALFGNYLLPLSTLRASYVIGLSGTALYLLGCTIGIKCQ